MPRFRLASWSVVREKRSSAEDARPELLSASATEEPMLSTSRAEREQKWVMPVTACAGQVKLVQRQATFPSSFMMGLPQAGHSPFVASRML